MPRGRRQARPQNWGKEWYLKRLAESELAGKSHNQMHDEMAAEAGGGCSGDALKHEVNRWRRDPEFTRAYYQVSGTVRHFSPKLEDRPGMEDWKMRWCEAYLRTRKRLAACEEIGVALSTVRNVLDPKSTTYDQHFVDMVQEVEQNLIAGLEANVDDAIEMVRDSGDGKTLGFMSLEILSRLDRVKWARNENRFINGEITHTHQIAAKTEAAVLAAAQISQRLFPPPPVELPEPDVVEAEVVEERRTG